MPAKWLKEPIDNLATLIAATETFQQLTDSADAEEARKRIHFLEANDGINDDEDPGMVPIADPMPRAIVGTDGGWSRRKTSAGGWTTQAGPLWFVIEVPTPTGHKCNNRLAAEYMTSLLQELMDDLEKLSGQPGNLNVIEWEIETYPIEGRPKLNRGKEFWFSMVKAVVK